MLLLRTFFIDGERALRPMCLGREGMDGWVAVAACNDGLYPFVLEIPEPNMHVNVVKALNMQQIVKGNMTTTAIIGWLRKFGHDIDHTKKIV
jgi:hypothetical protein